MRELFAHVLALVKVTDIAADMSPTFDEQRGRGQQIRFERALGLARSAHVL